jgi:hypothetical protein
VLPMNIGPAQRQGFGEALRQDVQLPGPVRMRPAPPLGTRHPIMQLEGSEVGGQRSRKSGSGDKWSQLPPLDGANLFVRNELKPNAQVLAEADDAQRHPLLVAGQSGDGRVLAFAGDSTWRWPMLGFGDAHRRFWRQCVLWLAKKDEQTEGRVWIRLAGRQVMRGARVDFAVGAEDAQGAPISTANFDVAVQTPDGRAVAVRPTKTGEEWTASFRETTKPGDYRITVIAKDGNNELGKAEARFLVPNQDLELDRPAAEPTLMAQLAEMTKPEVKEEIVAKVTYWDTWPFFLIFVGLLGTEWFLRKRWGLV